MQLFEDIIKQLHSFVDNKRAAGMVTEYEVDSMKRWPAGKSGEIVMQSDTAIELGHPDTESTAFHLWTNKTGHINDGRVVIVGPDLDQINQKVRPFGKIILLEVEGFTQENSFERHRDIGRMRYDFNFSGYMMRAVSQAGREWSRVSCQALEDGFSLALLGHELVHAYRTNLFVKAVEVIIITESADDVRMVAELADRSERLIQALNKMAGELSFDCDTCDYTDICSEVEGLRSMRDTLQKGKGNV